jgi:hypothetical protein
MSMLSVHWWNKRGTALTILATLALMYAPLAEAQQRSRNRNRPNRAPAAAAVATAAAAAAATQATNGATTGTQTETASLSSNPKDIPTQVSATPPPSSLWVSSATTETLTKAIRREAWEAARYPVESSILRVQFVENWTPMGMMGMISEVEGSERPLTIAEARALADLFMNPANLSRELTPEDECTTNSPTLEIRWRSMEGMLKVQITPECNEVTFLGFNLAEEPLGTLRIGYGPGRESILKALRQVAAGMVPEEQLR